MFALKLSKCWSRALVFALAVGILCLLVPGAGSAQVSDKKTTVTFSQPVEIPGISAQALPADTYVFRLLDEQYSNRHIVQIFNADQTRLHATILAIPNSRLRSTDKTVITFEERPVGQPAAIKAWFYPGDTFGQEFVYPKSRAVELARIAREPVLYMPEEVAERVAAPATAAAEPPVIALREAPVGAVAPSGEEVAVESIVTPPPVTVASLPRTAGSFWLFALIGIASLSVGFSLRRVLCFHG